MTVTDLHVVLGATGGAGAAITRHLASHGMSTRAVSRRGTTAGAGPVDPVAADLTDPDQAKRAIHGADVVYMAAQPPYTDWSQSFPALLETVIGATAEADAKLVMVDNCYGYGPVDEPMTEDTPAVATDVKGTTRRLMAERLLAAHDRGEVRVTIGRASDYMGPTVTNSAIMALAFAPLTQPRGALRWMIRDDVAHSVAYMPDIAQGLVTLGTDPRADGRIWHLPHAPAITGADLLGLINDALPRPRRTGVVSRTMLRLAAPFHATSREALGIIHQWARPFEVDDSQYRAVFGGQATPLPDAVAATVAAVRGRDAGEA